MALRAVIFDIGDTLWRLNPLPDDLDARMVLALEEQAGADRGIAAKVVRRAMESARKRAGDGTHREPSIAIELQLAAERAGLKAGRDVYEQVADVVGEADVARFIANVRLADVFGEMRASGLFLGVLSNTWTRGVLLQRYLADLGAGEHVVAGVFSGDEGIRKPHHDIYRRALDGLDVEASEALFVGDRVVEDVIGPMAVGMRAVLTHEHRQEDPGDARPAAVVERLEDVMAVVQQLNTASGE
jgi:putative hydrolase of the HAD superfamily